MRRHLFQPTAEGEARLLLLIDAFTGRGKALEGRTKLAKLDFLLRNPAYLDRALGVDGVGDDDIETGMIRYRYGPWDPAYFALLGALVGRGLVSVVPISRGLGYRTTDAGHGLAGVIAEDSSWADIAQRARTLRRDFDRSGTSLKKLIYERFPEVSDASWGTRL
jgi:hypothetical protein